MNMMLDSLITSKTRIRILMRLFLNPAQKAYLRELSTEFGMSPGQLSSELRSLSEAGLLRNNRHGRQVNYRANTGHPLFPELQSMVKKALGMDRIVDSVIERLGNLKLAILLDDYAQGKDTGIIDLALVGDINRKNMLDLVAKTERFIDRKIRVLTLTPEEHSRLEPVLAARPQLLLWKAEQHAR